MPESIPNKTTQILVLSLMLAWSHAAVAQPPRYNSQAELLGAAATAPVGTKSALTTLVRFCADAFPPTTIPLTAAMKRWRDRNSFYLSASTGYREALELLMSDPKTEPGTQEILRKLIQTDVPRILSARTEALLEPIRINTENGKGESLCLDYVEALDSGKFDIRNNDPQLAEFIDRNAPQAANSGTSPKAIKPQDAEYAEALRNIIKSNLTYVATSGLNGNPAATFKITLFPNGEVLSIDKLKGSGLPDYDLALTNAITKSSPLPKKRDGTVERVFVIEFHMREPR
jgi:hypothetical protein